MERSRKHYFFRDASFLQKISRIASSTTTLNSHSFEACDNLVMFKHLPGAPRSRRTVIHPLLKKRHLLLQSSLIYTKIPENSLRKGKAAYTFGSKRRSKKKLEDIQAKLNMLEGSRDISKETYEALEEQMDVKAVRALRDQIASHRMHSHLCIKGLLSPKSPFTSCSFQRSSHRLCD